MFDKENKGFIKATQIGQILRTMGQAFEERDLKELIREFDTDGASFIIKMKEFISQNILLKFIIFQHSYSLITYF